MAVDECAAYGDDRASGELLRVQACTVRFPMPLMCTPFEPGCLSRAIESIDDEDELQDVYEHFDVLRFDDEDEE